MINIQFCLYVNTLSCFLDYPTVANVLKVLDKTKRIFFLLGKYI